jgi:hypothetical protein
VLILIPETLSVQTLLGSFPNDKPPALRFRALLTEGGAERLELVRG